MGGDTQTKGGGEARESSCNVCGKTGLEDCDWSRGKCRLEARTQSGVEGPAKALEVSWEDDDGRDGDRYRLVREANAKQPLKARLDVGHLREQGQRYVQSLMWSWRRPETN